MRERKSMMKYSIKAVAIWIIATAFTYPTIEVSLKGHLRSRSHRNTAGLVVFIRGGIENGMGHAVTDKNGDFILGFDDCRGCSPLRFYYVNEVKDTILLKTVKLKTDDPEITFWIR